MKRLCNLRSAGYKCLFVLFVAAAGLPASGWSQENPQESSTTEAPARELIQLAEANEARLLEARQKQALLTSELSQLQTQRKLIEDLIATLEQDSSSLNQRLQQAMDPAAASDKEQLTKRLTWLLAQQADASRSLDSLRAKETEVNSLLGYLNQAAVQSSVEAQLSNQLVDEQEARASDFWIGVQCDPAEATEVSAPDSFGETRVRITGGLKVITIYDNSPAKAAGLQVGDVILSMNDKNTNDIAELAAAVDEAGENEARLNLIREGGPVSIIVTPARRPAEDNLQPSAGQELLVESNPLTDARWFYTYGQAVPALPPDHEAIVRLHHGQPPEITITSGGKSWQVTAETIDQLPEELQPFARKELEIHSGASAIVYSPAGSAASLWQDFYKGHGEQVNAGETAEIRASLASIQRQLDDINNRLKSLEK